MDNRVISELLDICDLLGVDYDLDYLNSISSFCSKISYLLKLIYKFLGGK